MSKKIFLLTVCFLIILLSSCGKKNQEFRMDVSDNLSYFEAPRSYTINDITKYKTQFTHLYPKEKGNLIKLQEDPDNTFLWIKLTFKVPDELKDKNIGLYISKLRSASRLYLNGELIKEYGQLPPKEQGIGMEAINYMFNEPCLLKDDINTVYIQVWTNCMGSIGTDMFIGTQEDVKYFSQKNDFFNSQINLCFTTSMLIVFFMYTILYLAFRKQYKENNYYMVFALLCLYSSRFLFPFYIGNFSWIISKITFLTYIKIFFVDSAFITIYFANSFIIRFMKIQESKLEILIRNIFLVAAIAINLHAKSYGDIFKYLPLSLGIVLLNFYYSVPCIVRTFRNKETRYMAINLLSCFVPTFIGIILDFIFKIIQDNDRIFFFTVYGWQLTIVFFLTDLILQFYQTTIDNIALNGKLKSFSSTLENEVKARTEDLTIANDTLTKGLETVSFVQRNAMPQRQKSFDKWELSVEYEPLSSNVSGDFYDYYSIGQELMGLSLFDVSGHGISAGLMTILAKGIISPIFWNGIEKSENASQLLTKINQSFCEEKGSIDHYMTGLLFQMNENVNGECTLEMANAGHPYPLLYKASTKTIIELTYKGPLPQFGLIGVEDMEVSFQLVTEQIQENDILMCYTDGLTESTNIKNEEFGIEPAKEILKEYCHESASDISARIMNAFKDYTRNSEHLDDFTLLILKRGNSPDFIEEL